MRIPENLLFSLMAWPGLAFAAMACKLKKDEDSVHAFM